MGQKKAKNHHSQFWKEPFRESGSSFFLSAAMRGNAEKGYTPPNDFRKTGAKNNSGSHALKGEPLARESASKTDGKKTILWYI